MMKENIWKVDDPFLLAYLEKKFKEKMDNLINNPPMLPKIRRSQPVLLGDLIEGFKYEHRPGTGTEQTLS